jgi:hypothetical protein
LRSALKTASNNYRKLERNLILPSLILEVNRDVGQKVDNEVLHQYLLGELSKEERLQLEETYFADDDFFEQLLIAEDELITAYVHGDLSKSEMGRFETNFLASLEQREKVEFTKVLIKYFPASSVVKPPTIHPEPVSWRHSFTAFFRSQSLALRYSFVVGLFVFVCSGLWLLLETRQLRAQLEQTQMERAALEQQEQKLQKQTADQRIRNDRLVEGLQKEQGRSDLLEQELAGLKSRPHITSFVLTSSLIRGDKGQKKLVIEPETELLQLRLNMENDPGYKSYRAVLQTVEGDEIWKEDRLKIRSSNFGKVAVMSLSPGLLTTGDYIVTLFGITQEGNSDDICDYYFRVVKK